MNDNRENFKNQIFNSLKFLKIKEEIEKWQKTDSGINSVLAVPVVEAIISLCEEIKLKYENLPEDNPYHPNNISESYTEPIQTGIKQWSVFVKKFKGMKECIGVIEHKFNNFYDAEQFSKNNWNLGDYY